MNPNNPAWRWATRSALMALLATAACNRNSNELPPATDRPAQYTQDVQLDGRTVLRVLVLQSRYATAGTDTVYVLAQRVGGGLSGLPEKIVILMEGCRSAEGSYSTCPVLDTAHVTLAAAGADTLFKLSNSGLLPSPATFRFGVLRGDGGHPLAAVYAAPESYAGALQDSVHRYTARVRGYVLSDGEAVFRLKADTVEYNITGRFLPQSLAFEGLLSEGGVVQSPVGYDSVQMGGGVRLPADTGGGVLRDSLRLGRVLPDGVNRFYLYLKK